MSDRDRDELALTIAHPKHSPTGMVTEPMPDECGRCVDALLAADRLIGLGWRRSTVTPEQVEVPRYDDESLGRISPRRIPTRRQTANAEADITDAQSTVTPEQVEAAAGAMVDVDCTAYPATSSAILMARAAARAFGLSVAEGDS